MLLPAIVRVVVVLKVCLVRLNTVVAFEASCRFLGRQDVGPLINQVVDIGLHRHRHRVVDLLLEQSALHNADQKP